MMDTKWIDESWERYRNLYEECKNSSETALASYTVCMMRLLNVLASMKDDALYRYEQHIFMQPYRVFFNFFIEHVHMAIDDKSPNKQILVKDIEDAVNHVSVAFKFILDATANTDRQTLSSYVVNTELYDLPPILLSFYSDMMQNAVEVLCEKDEKDKYAFLIYPNVNNNIKSKLLFRDSALHVKEQDDRQHRGRVTIVYISATIIDKVHVVPFYLIHEVFHVVTSLERKRVYRAECLLKDMMAYVKQEIMGDIWTKYKDDTGVQSFIKEIMKKYFDTKEKEKSYKQMSREKGNDFSFYLMYTIEDLGEYTRSRLLSCLREVDYVMVEWLNCIALGHDYEDFKNNYEKYYDITETIKNNVQTMLLTESYKGRLEDLSYLYKECYADLCTRILVQIGDDAYENMFKQAVLFDVDKDNQLGKRAQARIDLVNAVMKNINSGKSTNKGIADDQFPNLLAYLDECKNAVSARKDRDGWNEFGQKLNDIVDSNADRDETEMLFQILSGKRYFNDEVVEKKE